MIKEDSFLTGKKDITKIKNSNFWRLRVGDYRIFYDVDKINKIVYILSVRHCSNANREL